MPNARSSSSLRNTKSTRAPETQDPSSGEVQEGSPRIPPEQKSRKPKASAGSLLAEARGRAGLSQADVASQANLLVETIQALENDDFRGLPEPPQVHDHLHMYARIVKLSPKQVIHMFDRQYRNEFGYYARSHSRPGRPSGILWKIAALLVILLGLFAAWQGYKKLQESYFAENPVTGAEPELPAEFPGAPGVPDPVPAWFTMPDAVARAAPKEDSGIAAAGRSDGYPGNEWTAGTLGRDEEGPSDSGKQSFVLTFTEACWVQVMDADSRLLVRDLFLEGVTMTVQGKAPFRVLLGNSPGALLEVNGKQFDHSRHIRAKKVAIFRLSDSLFE